MYVKFTAEFSCKHARNANALNVTSILVLLCFQSSSSNDGSEGNCGMALLQRSQNKPGFHRDIVTYVEWDASSFSDLEDCQLLLVEHVPSGIYIDPDQIRNGEQFGGPKVLSKEVVNVESMAHHSSSNKIFVFPKVVINSRLRTITTNISLPIHLRYHQAVQGNTIVSVSISSPTILGRCNGINSLEKQCGTELIKAPCYNEAPSVLCDWIMLKSFSKGQSSSNTALVFHVPVGQIEHSWAIIALTVLSAMTGCGLILWDSLAGTEDTIDDLQTNIPPSDRPDGCIVWHEWNKPLSEELERVQNQAIRVASPQGQ